MRHQIDHTKTWQDPFCPWSYTSPLGTKIFCAFLAYCICYGIGREDGNQDLLWGINYTKPFMRYSRYNQEYLYSVGRGARRGGLDLEPWKLISTFWRVHLWYIEKIVYIILDWRVWFQLLEPLNILIYYRTRFWGLVPGNLFLYKEQMYT